MSVKVTHKNPDYFKNIRERFEQAKPMECKIGFPAEMANAVDANGVTDLQKAVWNNFGAKNPGGQPFFKKKNGEIVYVSRKNPKAAKMAKTKPFEVKARPFAENAAKAIKENWPQVLDAEIQRQIRKKIFLDMDALLKAAGVLGKAEYQRAIDNMTIPKNATSTIKKKGSSHPLIASGDMKRNVTYVILEVGGGGSKA